MRNLREYDGGCSIPVGYEYLHRARNTVNSLADTEAGAKWPPPDLRTRQNYQRFSMKLYDGTYSAFRKFIALVDNSERELPYNMLKLNYFKRVVDSIVGLSFNNEITVSASDPTTTLALQQLVDRTHFVDSMRSCLMLTEIYGDSILRVNKTGVNVLPPYWGLKCVNSHDIDKVERIILYEYLYRPDSQDTAYAIRFEEHSSRGIYEFVRELNGTTLGNKIQVTYRGRVISSEGNFYELSKNTDNSTAIWCTLNNGVSIYGMSVLDDIKDIVFSLESLASMREYTVRENTQPFMVLGMSMFTTDEATGSYKLKKINDRYIIKDQSGDPVYLEWGGQNTVHARELQEDLMQNLYELSEISKVAMSGDYNGNVSADTIKTAAQSSTEKASRDLGKLWSYFQQALYTLARLNSIDVRLEDINIMFSVDRTMDDKTVAEVCKIFSEMGLLSSRTLRKKYLGYTDNQCDTEEQTILAEQSSSQRKEII